MKRTDKKEKQHKRGFFASLWRVVRTILIVAAGAMAAFLLFFAVKLLNIDSWKDFDPDKILSAPQRLLYTMAAMRRPCACTQRRTGYISA